MTIIIGMKASDGYLLGADCLIRYADRTEQLNKINPFNNLNGSSKNPKISATYIASAGDLTFGRMLDRHFYQWLRQDPSRSFKLTENFVLSTRLRELNDRIDEINKQLKFKPYTRWTKNDHDLNGEKEKLTESRNPRAFIEHTDNGYFSHAALRTSLELGIDMIHIANGSVRSIDTYLTDGSGSDIANSVLGQSYQEDLTLEQSLNIFSRAMNCVLEDSENYRGFSLVVVRTLSEQGLLIEEFQDLETNRIDPNNMDSYFISSGLGRTIMD